MPWNGSGVFNRVYSWVADRDAGLDILADRMDQDSNDIAQGLMHCLTVNGETVPAANLPMNGYRVTGAGAGAADTDYATVGQVKNGGGGIATGGFLPIAGGTLTGNLVVANASEPSLTCHLTGAGDVAMGLWTFANSLRFGKMTNTGVPTNLHLFIDATSGLVTANFGVYSKTTLNADGDISSGNAIIANARIEAGGNITAGGSITATNAVNAGGNVNAGLRVIAIGDVVAGGALQGASLTVSGASTLHALNAGATTLTGTLGVAGVSTLHAVNATTGNFSSTLTGAAANFSGAVATGTLTITGGLTTTGTINAASQITAQNGIRPSVDNGSACGIPGQAWGGCAAYAFQTISDLRLKRDIEPLPPVASLVAAIAPKRFRWAEPGADDGGGLHWGFVAQEVEAAMSAAGLEFAGARHGSDPKGSPEGGVASLDHNEMVAVLWKAVQELSARVVALEARG